MRAEALLLALDVDDLHRGHLDGLVLLAEHELDGRLHLGLGRVLQHAEDDLLVLVGDERALFRHDRREQHRHQALVTVFGWRTHPSAPRRDAALMTTAPRIGSRRPW